MTWWIRLSTSYADDPAIIEAGEGAEVLFTRALAYVGRVESDGYIPADQIPRLTPVNSRARLAALVRVGVFVKDPERAGYLIVNWSKWQEDHTSMERSRVLARERASRYRASKKARDVSRDESRDVTHLEVEEELTPLPPPSGGMKSRCQRHKRKRAGCLDCAQPYTAPADEPRCIVHRQTLPCRGCAADAKAGEA